MKITRQYPDKLILTLDDGTEHDVAELLVDLVKKPVKKAPVKKKVEDKK